MGWLDNLWRRRQGGTTDTERDRAEARTEEEERVSQREEADALEEEAHRHRDEEIFREPRIPPGTG
jgi:hypothetical protein